MSSSGSIWSALSGVAATSDELNLLDGNTSVGASITIANTDGFIVNDAGTTKLIPASDVATYAAASAGDITSVSAGDGLTGGGNSGDLTLTVGAGTGIDVAADAISVDVSDFMANGSNNRVVTATGTDAMNGEANLTFDGNTLTVTDAVSDTNAGTYTALDINFDKTGSSSSDNTMIGLNIDMDNTTATGGTNNMTAIKVTPTCTHTSGSGTVNIKGLEVIATGGIPNETSTVRALDLQSTGGDYTQGIHINTDDANGWDLKIVSSADTGDFCTLAVAANGATELKTVDDDGANADLTFTVDGTFDVTATSSSFSSGVNVAGTTAHAASLVVDGAAASVALKEMANAPADTAAFGQLWVKTATPNELYFTNDAGNDIQITSGTAIAGGGGGSAADDLNLILHTQVFS